MTLRNPKVVKDKVTGELITVPRTSTTDRPFKRLEKSLPREAFAEALSTVQDPRCEILMRMLCDPAFRRRSLPSLARECNLTYAQVLRYVTQFRIDQGILAMSSHVPQILVDTAIDAKSKLVTCPECKGKKVIETVDKKGEVLDEHPCHVCDGKGKLRKSGDTDARRLVFETVGLTNKGKGPLVAVQVNSGQSVEDSVSMVHEALDVTAEPAK